MFIGTFLTAQQFFIGDQLLILLKVSSFFVHNRVMDACGKLGKFKENQIRPKKIITLSPKRNKSHISAFFNVVSRKLPLIVAFQILSLLPQFIHSSTCHKNLSITFYNKTFHFGTNIRPICNF